MSRHGLAAVLFLAWLVAAHAFVPCTTKADCDYSGCSDVTEGCKGEKCAQSVDTWGFKCIRSASLGVSYCAHEFFCEGGPCDRQCEAPRDCVKGTYSESGRDEAGPGACRPCERGWTTDGSKASSAKACNVVTSENQGIQLCMSRDSFLPDAELADGATCLSQARSWMDIADTQKHCSSGSVHFEMETLAARCCSDAKSMCWVAPAPSPTHVVKMALTLPVPLATFDSQHRPSLQRAIARVVRVSVADVLIVKTEPIALQDCQDCTYVKVNIKARSKVSATDMQDKLTEENINREAARDGVPSATMQSIVNVFEASDSDSADVGTGGGVDTTVVVIGLGIAGALLVLGIALFSGGSRAPSADEVTEKEMDMEKGGKIAVSATRDSRDIRASTISELTR